MNAGTQRVQVICNRTGTSYYPEGDYCPKAGEVRFTCPCGKCSAAEYREPEGVPV